MPRRRGEGRRRRPFFARMFRRWNFLMTVVGYLATIYLLGRGVVYLLVRAAALKAGLP